MLQKIENMKYSISADFRSHEIKHLGSNLDLRTWCVFTLNSVDGLLLLKYRTDKNENVK
jgi:hypothetical protein